jgi:hypothetical protein
MNIFEKLNLAREKFHSLKLEKTGKNTFAGYKYFELGDFLIPALRVFKEVGLTAVVSFEKEVASMTIFNTEKPEQSLVISSPMGSAALKGCHEVQNIGAVETYQRRYLWVAALEIVEHDAVDSAPLDAEDHSGGLVQKDGKLTRPKADRTLVMQVSRAIAEHITQGREMGALQEWELAVEKGVDFAKDVWARLTTPEHDKLRELTGKVKETA